MGVFHYFAGLDQDDVGRKLVKFKQTVLNAMAGKTDVNAMMALLTKDGSCAGHSVVWLEEKLEGRANFEQRYNRKMTGSEASYITGARIQRGLAAVNKSNQFDINFPKFLKKNTQLEATLIELRNAELEAALQAASNRLGSGEGCMLSFSIGNLGWCHAIALYRQGKQTFFFDPNVGEYEILNYSKFFAKFADIYKNNFKVTTLGALVFKVTRVNDNEG